MIDWNGNGKIDPVDIGITMSFLEDETQKSSTHKGSGCLTTLITLVGIVSLCVLMLCLLVN